MSLLARKNETQSVELRNTKVFMMQENKIP